MYHQSDPMKNSSGYLTQFTNTVLASRGNTG